MRCNISCSVSCVSKIDVSTSLMILFTVREKFSLSVIKNSLASLYLFVIVLIQQLIPNCLISLQSCCSICNTLSLVRESLSLSIDIIKGWTGLFSFKRESSFLVLLILPSPIASPPMSIIERASISPSTTKMGWSAFLRACALKIWVWPTLLLFSAMPL